MRTCLYIVGLYLSLILIIYSIMSFHGGNADIYEGELEVISQKTNQEKVFGRYHRNIHGKYEYYTCLSMIFACYRQQEFLSRSETFSPLESIRVMSALNKSF